MLLLHPLPCLTDGGASCGCQVEVEELRAAIAQASAELDDTQAALRSVERRDSVAGDDGNVASDAEGATAGAGASKAGAGAADAGEAARVQELQAEVSACV